MEVEGTGVHRPKVHVWGGITARGALGIEVFEENLKSSKYINIVKKKQKELDRLYPEGWLWH